MVVDIAIRDRTGTIFQKEFPFANLTERAGTLKVRFDRLPVNVPEIRFFVAILRGGSGEIFDWKRNIRLRLKAAASNTGTIHMDACVV
jgi:hypothetical protein